jgi:hypothetical protein
MVKQEPSETGYAPQRRFVTNTFLLEQEEFVRKILYLKVSFTIQTESILQYCTKIRQKNEKFQRALTQK